MYLSGLRLAESLLDVNIDGTQSTGAKRPCTTTENFWRYSEGTPALYDRAGLCFRVYWTIVRVLE
jgi:hypothetical protein